MVIFDQAQPRITNHKITYTLYTLPEEAAACNYAKSNIYPFAFIAWLNIGFQAVKQITHNCTFNVRS